MPELLTPDLCVIGAGAGGLSAAAAAAALGVSVVLVEKAEMGGEGLAHGCVPAQALIAAAAAANGMRHAGRFGIASGEPRVDFALTLRHVEQVVAAIAPDRRAARFAAMRVKVIRAAARFTARDRCDAGGFAVKARRFVIATGSSPAVPAIPGIELVHALTTESVFDLAALPQRLVVLGGTPAGLELAQAFRRLGAEVTVLDAGPLLPGEDPELAHAALARLARDGVVLRDSVGISRIEPRGAGVRLFLAGPLLEETIDGSHLLIAAGRAPNVEGIGLEAAGVAFDKSGIKTGAGMRTSNRRIHAVGDVTGDGGSSHAARHHAGLALRHALFRRALQADPLLVPRVTFTDPEIAVIGMSEREARENKLKIDVLRWPFAENDRARTERDTAGLIKVIVGKGGRILGAGIAGKGAGELIGLWALAVSKGLEIGDIAGLVLPYATRGEISRQVAATSHAFALRNPRLPRVLRFLRMFG